MLYDKGHLPIKSEFQWPPLISIASCMAITRDTNAFGITIFKPRCGVSTEEYDESERLKATDNKEQMKLDCSVSFDRRCRIHLVNH